MVSILIASMFTLWLVLAYLLFLHEPRNAVLMWNKKTSWYTVFFKSLLTESSNIGWHIGYKEWIIIIGFCTTLVFIISLVSQNFFILIVLFFIIYYLPRFLITKIKQAKRINMLKKLPDPLRQFVSRLPDQENVVLAAEKSLFGISDPDIKELFLNFVKDASLGTSIQEALVNMKERVSLRKFDTFVDFLIQAHYEGFSQESMSALGKAIEAIEFDLRAIEKVKEKSKSQKTKLYLALGTAWLFPFILSFASTAGSNVYIQTIPGKILILLYFVGTIIVYIKGEEYLSLCLEEL